MASVPEGDWRRRWPPALYWARVTLAVAITLALLAAARQVKDILILVLVALVLAIGLDPAVRRLQKRGFKRGLAIATIMLGTVAFLVVFLALVVPPLVREGTQFAHEFPGTIDRLKTQSGFVGDLVRKYGVSTKLSDVTSQLPSIASASVGSILGITKSVGTVIFKFLTIGVLTIYFLSALPKARKSAITLFVPGRRDQAGRVLEEALAKIGGYVSGNIIISIIAGGLAFIALTVIGVPFAAALAMWVAIADLIPSVGAMLGAIVAVLVALTSSFGDAVLTLGYFVAYQQLIENYWLAPRVFRHTIDLSPPAVIVSALIGGSLAGFAGVLIALPVAATVKVVLNDVWLQRRMSEQEPEPADAEDEAAHPT